MSDEKDRERVTAEITLSHLMRLGNEQGCPVSRKQALALLARRIKQERGEDLKTCIDGELRPDGARRL